MNDKITNDVNPDDENIARKLSQVAEQTNANVQFAAELEERLRNTRQPRVSWSVLFFKQILPALPWVVVMILLALALSWSIKSLIPAPQPAIQNIPATSVTATPTPEVSGTAVNTQVPTPNVDNSGGYDWRSTKLYLAQPLPQSPAEANVYIAQPEQPATIESVRALADVFGLKGEIFEAELEPNAPSAFSVVDGNQRLNVRSDRYFEYLPDYTKVSSEGPFSTNNPNAEAIIQEFMLSHNFSFSYKVEPSGLYQAYYVQALSPDGFPLHHEFFAQNGLLFRLNNTEIVSVSASLLKYDAVGTYGIKSAEEAFQQVVASTNFNGMIESVHSSTKPPQIWKRSYSANETVTLYGFLNATKAVDSTEVMVSIDNFVAKGNLAGVEKLGKITLVKATGQFTLENGNQIFNLESWEVFMRDDHGYSGKDAFLGTLQKQGEDVVFVSEKGTFSMHGVPSEIPLPLENTYVYGVILGDTFEWEGIEHSENSESGRGGGGGSGTGFYKLNLSGPPVPFPSPTAQPESNQGYVEYIIQEGDTVLSIAQAFGLGKTPEKILQANSWLADEGVLTPGKTLLIPMTQSVSYQAATTEYVVQENDTLASIALNFGIAVDELRRANGITNTDNTVFVGQTLFIPGQQKENPLVGRRFEKQRGTLVINIYRQPDGSSRNEFGFGIKNQDGSLFYALLENLSYQAVLAYHNRPLDIWGAVKYVDKNGIPVISVERYEAPYPGLRFQLVQGTQKSVEIDGVTATVFTTDKGKSYVQMSTDGSRLENSIIGNVGDQVYAEVLLVPDEAFGEYPAMRIFNMGLAIDPKNGQPATITIEADQPSVMDEVPLLPSEISAAPTLTIEKVELVYYVPDSRYATFDETSGAQYIQPAWRFYGHFENGDEFETLIQVLKQEYLIPQLAPYTPPG